MKSFLRSCLLVLTATATNAQDKQATLEEAAAKRWSEERVDRIAADADGNGITTSDIRRQIDPIAPAPGPMPSFPRPSTTSPPKP